MARTAISLATNHRVDAQTKSALEMTIRAIFTGIVSNTEKKSPQKSELN